MKTLTWSTGILCGITLALLAGCHTFPNASGLSAAPVVPMDNEQIVRDQLIIVVDVTGSIGSRSEFAYEKALAQAFTGAMPDGTYESGIDSFAGVKSNQWVNLPLAPFDRARMVQGAASVEPLGSLTPLARAILNQKAEVSGKMGSGALLVFSDGKVRIPENVLEACQSLKAAHGGDFCIYTVQVGTSERGKKLLQDMATVNGCGKYYDGALLNSPAAIDGLVRDIFLGAKAMPKEMPKEVSKPATKIVVWNLKIINFDNDMSVILPMYDVQLDEAAAILKANPQMHILLVGNTDSNASNAYNQGLSQRRVDAAKAALVKRGVDPSQLKTRADGEESPVVPNDSPANMHHNRRVDLTVIE